jgi:hypothetical protein
LTSDERCEPLLSSGEQWAIRTVYEGCTIDGWDRRWPSWVAVLATDQRWALISDRDVQTPPGHIMTGTWLDVVKVDNIKEGHRLDTLDGTVVRLTGISSLSNAVGTETFYKMLMPARP